MKRLWIYAAGSVVVLSLTSSSHAGLGNDDSWFNGVSAPKFTPSGSSGESGSSSGWTPAPPPAPPPGPTKEELEARDLRESSDDYVDRGNKYYRQGDWDRAIAFYQKALKEDSDNDDARANLKKAIAKRDAQEQQRRAAEAQLAAQKEQQRQEQIRQYVAKRDKVIEEARAGYNAQLQRLMVEADHIQVPPPVLPPHIHEGVLLGLFDPQEEAEAALTAARSPFTGKEYAKDAIFSTADSKNASEAVRGFVDNQTVGEYTLNSEHGKQLIARLNGAQFDRLIAHSNGATIAEAMIRRGIIKVDELNVLGGDRSLINRSGYQNLIDAGLVKRIVVWVNPGDVIPVGSSTVPYVTPSVSVAPLLTSAEHMANVATGNHQGGDATVEYRLMKGAQYVGQTINADKTIFAPHDLVKSYLPNISSYLSSRQKG